MYRFVPRESSELERIVLVVRFTSFTVKVASATIFTDYSTVVVVSVTNDVRDVTVTLANLTTTLEQRHNDDDERQIHDTRVRRVGMNRFKHQKDPSHPSAGVVLSLPAMFQLLQYVIPIVTAQTYSGRTMASTAACRAAMCGAYWVCAFCKHTSKSRAVA